MSATSNYSGLLSSAGGACHWSPGPSQTLAGNIYAVDGRDILRQLATHSDRVLEKKFLKQLLEQGAMNTSVRVDHSGVHVECDLPDDEHLESALLPLRMFLQGREPFAFERLRDIRVCDGVSHTWISERDRHLDLFDEYMDAPSLYRREGRPRSNREFFDILLYGWYAHSNHDKRHEAEEILANPVLGPILRFKFQEGVLMVVQTVQFLAKATHQELGTEAILTWVIKEWNDNPRRLLLKLLRVTCAFSH